MLSRWLSLQVSNISTVGSNPTPLIFFGLLVTNFGRVAGNFWFIAPEQAEGGDIQGGRFVETSLPQTANRRRLPECLVLRETRPVT